MGSRSGTTSSTCCGARGNGMGSILRLSLRAEEEPPLAHPIRAHGEVGDDMSNLRYREVGHDGVPSLMQVELKVLPEVDGVPSKAEGPLAVAALGAIPIGVEETGPCVSVGNTGERGDGPRRAGVCRTDLLAVLEQEVVACRVRQ